MSKSNILSYPTQLLVELNQCEALYVINPQERNIPSLSFDDIPFAQQTDYIRLTAITYQSFGLDKNKALRDEVLYFFALLYEKELGENRGFY